MEGKQLIQIGLVVAALGAAGFFIWKNSDALDPDNPEITTRKISYLCEKCKEGFQATVGESREYYAEHRTDLPCPKCGEGKNVQPAFKCPSCAKYMLPVGHGSPPKNCPSCKVAIPRDVE